MTIEEINELFARRPAFQMTSVVTEMGAGFQKKATLVYSDANGISCSVPVGGDEFEFKTLVPGTLVLSTGRCSPCSDDRQFGRRYAAMLNAVLCLKQLTSLDARHANLEPGADLDALLKGG